MTFNELALDNHENAKVVAESAKHDGGEAYKDIVQMQQHELIQGLTECEIMQSNEPLEAKGVLNKVDLVTMHDRKPMEKPVVSTYDKAQYGNGYSIFRYTGSHDDGCVIVSNMDGTDTKTYVDGFNASVTRFANGTVQFQKSYESPMSDEVLRKAHVPNAESFVIYPNGSGKAWDGFEKKWRIDESTGKAVKDMINNLIDQEFTEFENGLKNSPRPKS